jgi:hypothetical protein
VEPKIHYTFVKEIREEKKIKKTYFIFGGTKKLLYFYKTIKKNKL